MISLKDYIIKEELDDNIFWLLDTWFDRNEDEQKEFMEIVLKCIDDKVITIENITKYLKDTKLNTHLQQFVNFIDNDIKPNSNKDYYNRFKDILQQCTNKYKVKHKL